MNQIKPTMYQVLRPARYNHLLYLLINKEGKITEVINKRYDEEKPNKCLSLIELPRIDVSIREYKFFLKRYEK